MFIASIIVRIAALVWALLALGRLRDWKMGLLVIFVTFTTLNQFAIVIEDTEIWSVGFIKETGLFGMIVSALVFACVFALDSALVDGQRARSRLKNSEENLVQFASNIQDILWITSADHKQFFYVSSTFESLWGRSCDELYACASLWNEAIHADDVQRVNIAYASVLEDKSLNVEYRVQRPEGGVIWVHDRGSVVLDEQGAVQRIVGTTEDVTLRKLAQTEMMKAKEAAVVASRTKSEFLANMSHEMRSPLTAVLGYTELLIDENWGRAGTLEHLATLKRNGEHLLDVINDILDLSKIEAGRLDIHDVLISPIQIVSDVQSLMQAVADEKELSLEVEFEGGIPAKIHSDPTRLRQILLNLVGNAVKFTNVGHVRLVSRLGVNDSGHSTMEFEVVDTGIGMSAEEVDGLFSTFHQVDTSESRKYGGTGLGLAISRRLARMMGGDIDVKSQPDVGTRFCLTLPIGAVPSDTMIYDAEAHLLNEKSEADTGAFSREDEKLACRVLLAEDSRDNQRLVSMVLTKAGADVTVAENGDIAIRRATNSLRMNEPFDVILMDMQMPVMDGFTAAKELRSNGYELPIIALTANAMAGDRETCLEAGCDDYTTKPLDRSRLITLVSRYAQIAAAQVALTKR